MGINQFTEKNLSRPRGPVCCCSTAEASPCSISIHPLGRICISIGGAPEDGSRLVPEPVWRRMFSSNDAAGPPIFIWARAKWVAIARKTTKLQRNTASSRRVCTNENIAAQFEPRRSSCKWKNHVRRTMEGACGPGGRSRSPTPADSPWPREGATSNRIKVPAGNARSLFTAGAIALESCVLLQDTASILAGEAQHLCWFSGLQQGHAVAHGTNPFAANTTISNAAQPLRIRAL
jgi:hypothetical protein